MIRRLFVLALAALCFAAGCSSSEPLDSVADAPVPAVAEQAVADTAEAVEESEPAPSKRPASTEGDRDDPHLDDPHLDDRHLDDRELHNAARDNAPIGAPAPASGEIRDVDFFNDFTYPVGFDEEAAVTVADGEFIDEPGYLWFNVWEVQYGDLDDDGTDEAVVQTGFNTGGSGQFGRLAVWDIVGGHVVERGWIGTGDRADGGLWHYEIRDGFVITENFLTDQGACCPNMLYQSRLTLLADGLRTINSIPPVRWMTLNSYDEPDTELKFLPATSGAVVQLSASDETNELLFEAGAGQWVTVTRRRGPDAGIVIFDEADRVVAQSANSELEIELPTSGLFRIVFTNDTTVLRSTIVDLAITGTGLAGESTWTPGVRELIVDDDPLVRLLTVAPVFDLSDNGRLNGAIDAWIDEQTDWWVADVVEYPPLEREGSDATTGGEYELFYDTTLVSDTLASFRWNWYEYVCCRPYPNYGSKALVIDLTQRRIIPVAEILDLTRLDEIHEIWLSEADAAEVLPVDYLDWIGDDGPAFSSLALTPTGVELGTDRQGAIGGTLTVVSYEALGDLVDADLVSRARTGVTPLRLVEPHN